MPEGSDQEKTEDATPKKRQEAREQGQFARSSEAGTAVGLIAGTLMLMMNGQHILDTLTTKTTAWLSLLGRGSLGSEDLMYLTRDLMSSVVVAVIPLLAVIALASGAYQVAQAGGIAVYWKRMAPKPSKINPVTGLKKIVSLRSVVRLGVSLAKLAAIIGVIYGTLSSRMIELTSFSDRGSLDSMSTLMEIVLAVLLRVSLLLIVIAAIDYSYQKWQTDKELRMTKEEVKEERKSSDGDPQVKGRIRSAQREAARARMMGAVPDADVVVTNPTHYSIALRYRESDFHAPRVVAKGLDLIALRIREVAKEHGIPLIEDRPLAQALYRDVDIGDEIPPRFYKAVAVIMAHLWKKRQAATT